MINDKMQSESLKTQQGSGYSHPKLSNLQCVSGPTQWTATVYMDQPYSAG